MPSFPFRIIRWYSTRLLQHDQAGRNTIKPVIRISTAGIVLGTVAMLLSTMVVTGFRNEITAKVTGFVANYRISAMSTQDSFEEVPVSLSAADIQGIRQIPGIRHLQGFAHKASLMKVEDEIHGVVLKGIDRDFNREFFNKKITQGHFPDLKDTSYSKEVIISEYLSKKLNLKTGDPFLLYFIQNDRKVRKVTVSGIYKTGLSEEFDQLYILCDINLIRRINNWDSSLYGGFEIFTNEADDGEQLYNRIYEKTGFDLDLKSSRDLYPQIFQWLELQNLNVIVILTLIALVAGITMISTLLIIVMEHSREIGILKSMGAQDTFTGSIFGSVAFFILMRGLLTGNIIAMTIAFIQYKTGFIGLDEESYYLSQVPIAFSWQGWLLINGIIFFTGSLLVLVSSKIISNIRPISVLRFD